MIFEIFQQSFMVRAFEAGLIVAVIAPLIGIFLVLRRYSLIADTLAHVSLAGLALGALLKIDPFLSALGVTAAASVGIERLRYSRRILGDTALALFLSGSLALAVIILSLAGGSATSLVSYLFGNILTVSAADVLTIAVLGLAVVVMVALFFKELIFVTFDEEAARVSGIPVRLVNTVLILTAAITVALAIPVIGVLLIAALIVIPVQTALLFRKGMTAILLISEAVAIAAVVAGIIISFYLDLPTGATIVLVLLGMFAVVYFLKRK